MSTAAETTLVLLKPDAIRRNLIGTILTRLEAADLTITRLRTIEADEDLLRQHYAEHAEKDFFDNLLRFMQERPIIAAQVDGRNAVSVVRKLIGDTEPRNAAAGTIRGDLATDSYEAADQTDRVVENLIHASATIEGAQTELRL